MIRVAAKKSAAPAWHELFIRMLPAIRRHAHIAFRHLGTDARQEAIQNAVCNACAAIARLAELGKLDLAYATVLAASPSPRPATAGMLGCPLNCQDVSSRYCRQRKGVTVERLDRFDKEETHGGRPSWRTTRLAPARHRRLPYVILRTGSTRLPRRDRRIAENLALGQSHRRRGEEIQGQ